jgi:hypothetical protein
MDRIGRMEERGKGEMVKREITKLALPLPLFPFYPLPLLPVSLSCPSCPSLLIPILAFRG